jgi:hypothetical protein
VHATVFPEHPFEITLLVNIFLEADQGPRVPFQIRRILIASPIFRLRTGQLVPLLAGNLAATAGGTTRQIDYFDKFLFHLLTP